MNLTKASESISSNINKDRSLRRDEKDLDYVAIKRNTHGYTREKTILLSPPRRPSNFSFPQKRNIPLPESPPPNALDQTQCKDNDEIVVTKSSFPNEKQINQSSAVSSSHTRNARNSVIRSTSGLKRSFIRRPPTIDHEENNAQSSTILKPFNLKEEPSFEDTNQVESTELPPTFSEKNMNRRESLKAWGSSRELISRKVANKLDPPTSSNPGRLSIYVKTSAFKWNSNKESQSTFFRFCLRKNDGKAISQQTIPSKCCTSQTDIEVKEMLRFNLMNPTDFTNDHGDIIMSLHLIESSLTDEVIIGKANFSVLRFINSKETWKETISIENQNAVVHLQIEAKFHHVVRGMFIITVQKATGLHCKSTSQVSVEIGGTKRSTKQVFSDENSGECIFNNEELHFSVDENNWFQNATVIMSSDKDIEDNQDAAACDDFDIVQYLCHDVLKTNDLTVTMLKPQSTKNKNIQLLLSLKFLKAGTLNIHVIEAKNLRGDKIIPYTLSFDSKSLASDFIGTTKPVICTNGKVEWNEKVMMFPVDQHLLSMKCLQCMSHSNIGEEIDVIGNYEISLLPVYKNGQIDTWIDLKFKNEFDTLIDGGQIHLSLKFYGDDRIKFPQHRPDLPSFDEKDRVYSQSLATTDTLRSSIGVTPPVKSFEESLVKENIEYDLEFSDEDIKDAFRFLDLDKNGYIGIAEIRHILKCMGFSILDEELDMVILQRIYVVYEQCIHKLYFVLND